MKKMMEQEKTKVTSQCVEKMRIPILHDGKNYCFAQQYMLKKGIKVLGDDEVKNTAI